MTNILDKIDDCVLSGCEKLLEGYNYITGKGKASLANGLMSAGGITASIGGYLIDEWLGYITIPAYFAKSYMDNITHKQLENKERVNKNSGVLNNPIQYLTEKILGYTYLSSSTLEAGSFYFQPDDSSALLFIGCFLIGLSHHVMRVDNPDNGKNVFSKAKDRLSEIVSQPTSQEVKVNSREKYSGSLEDYIIQ